MNSDDASSNYIFLQTRTRNKTFKCFDSLQPFIKALGRDCAFVEGDWVASLNGDVILREVSYKVTHGFIIDAFTQWASATSSFLGKQNVRGMLNLIDNRIYCIDRVIRTPDWLAAGCRFPKMA